MTKPAEPCQDCGGPKDGVRGARFCNACRERRLPVWQQADKERGRRRALREKAERAADGRARAVRVRDDGMLRCSKCAVYKPSSAFGRNAGKRNGSASYCKPCYSTYLHESRLAKVFGLTLDQYDELLRLQDGRCAICRCMPRTQRLAVDHDHASGAIRGLLCQRCNQRVLGGASDRPEVLRRAANYLLRPPAVTRRPVRDLGEHDTAFVRSALEDARVSAGADGFYCAILEPGDVADIDEATVVMPLHVFARWAAS